LTNCLYFPLRASSIFSQVFAWTVYTCLLLPFFLFLWVLRCFSSPGAPLPIYVFNWEMLRVLRSGFPHSDIPGSKPVHGSPRLFAVFRVLLRHLAPRHPP